MQIAQLPPEGLVAYRRRTDPLAEQWYRDGIASRDEQKLRRVVDESFCSSLGDDALLALGELALERGDIDDARCYWEQINSLLRDPADRPLWLALRDIDLNSKWADVGRLWRERPQSPNWLAYPDTNLDLADIRARLILASIRAGQFDRAALELDAFRRWHPNAAGRLGGQQGSYVAALERLFASAHNWPADAQAANWPTFAGSQSRDGVAQPLGPMLAAAWPEPLQLAAQQKAMPPPNTPIIIGGAIGRQFMTFEPSEPQDPQLALRESQQPLSCFPIVVGDLAIANDGTRIRALDAATGRPAMTKDGVLYRDTSEQANRETRLGLAARFASMVVQGAPRHSLTEVNGIVYARVGPPTTTPTDPTQIAPAARLIGIDLAREGLLTFDARLTDKSWSFDGTPVSNGHHVWVALRKSDVTPHAYVACYDSASGAELWRTSIGAADSPAAGFGDEITNNLLTLVGERLYFNTNLGLVAALDATNGDIAWVHEYERATDTPLYSGRHLPLHFDRDPSPCLYHDGLVIVAPADTPAVFALDSLTGQRVWNTDELSDALHLLGVVGESLIVTGNQLWSLDVRSGKTRFAWPEGQHAGIRGMGRGLIAGEEVFWPTRNDIYVISAVTGQRTRPPISLSPFGSAGANLAAANGRLIIATREKLAALGPPAAFTPGQPSSPTTRTSRR
jgi:outer membrane protein assembly factor BamB